MYYFYVWLFITLFLQLTFRRSTHANNNLIAIIPTDSESESHANDLVSNNLSKPASSKVLTTDGTKTNDIQNLNDGGNLN